MNRSDHLKGFADRIEALIKVAGGVAPLSRAAGVSRASIDKWRNEGADPSTSNLIALADATKVTIEWLATGEGHKFRADKPTEPNLADHSPFVGVPRYNAAASAGHGSFVENAEILDHIPFTQEFLWKRLNRSNADGLIVVDARGDSMEPTIKDNDLLMIDMKQNGSNLTAAIYAFTYEDGFFVKRVNHLPDAIELRSDNKDYYPPFIIERRQTNSLNIIGRVVWIGHTP